MKQENQETEPEISQYNLEIRLEDMKGFPISDPATLVVECSKVLFYAANNYTNQDSFVINVPVLTKLDPSFLSTEGDITFENLVLKNLSEQDFVPNITLKIVQIVTPVENRGQEPMMY